jgi:IS30 family transposase
MLARVRAGERAGVVAADFGVHPRTVERLVAKQGGIPPRREGRSSRHLQPSEREEISRRIGQGESNLCIATALGRDPSTIWREINRNGGRDGYRAFAAERRACEQACRPRPSKLELNERLRVYVEERLELCWSPEQIAASLIVEFPDDPEMRVSHETIYQTLFVQTRGGLRKELTAHLRSGRTRRQPNATSRGTERRGKLVDMVSISERPAEADDRAVPGHWEGDLIMGAHNRSAIGTLVERTTRFLMLLHLPDGHSAEQVRLAMTAKIATLPDTLKRSITWDQGKEMAQHAQFRVDTGVQIYFCPPHSPWMRGSNENTNGLLRQYFPKGTDLAIYDEAHLDHVADELNGRPRQTLAWMKPSQAFNQLVATTA